MLACRAVERDQMPTNPQLASVTLILVSSSNDTDRARQGPLTKVNIKNIKDMGKATVLVMGTKPGEMIGQCTGVVMKTLRRPVRRDAVEHGSRNPAAKNEVDVEKLMGSRDNITALEATRETQSPAHLRKNVMSLGKATEVIERRGENQRVSQVTERNVHHTGQEEYRVALRPSSTRKDADLSSSKSSSLSVLPLIGVISTPGTKSMKASHARSSLGVEDLGAEMNP